MIRRSACFWLPGIDARFKEVPRRVASGPGALHRDEVSFIRQEESVGFEKKGCFQPPGSG